MLNSAQRSRRISIVLGLMVASLGGLLLVPPILQDPAYHQFADQRTLLGTPNFWNVVSNFPFILVGAVGLWQFRRASATVALFLGILLTGFGSSYYHLDPNDRTLFWDRLPMAISFMAILAITIEERVDTRTGSLLLWPLIAIGVFSLLLWRFMRLRSYLSSMTARSIRPAPLSADIRSSTSPRLPPALLFYDISRNASRSRL